MSGVDDDPFDGLVLDEEFVRGARLREAAADERRGAHQHRPARPNPPSAPRHFPARDRHPSGQRPPADDRARRLAREGWDEDPIDRPLRRRRHSTVLRMVAVLLVASMVVVYALSHLATLWGRPPTVEGSVGHEQSLSVDVGAEALVTLPG